jgi:hypothetical protein
MIISRIITTAILTFSLAGAAWAATPAQVGTYSGSIKVTATSASGKTSVKSDIQISIAADDQTTITIGGVEQVVSTVFYNATDGFCQCIAPTSTELNLLTFNFKGTAIKGTGAGIVISPGPPVTLSAATVSKFKLKKQ